MKCIAILTVLYILFCCFSPVRAQSTSVPALPNIIAPKTDAEKNIETDFSTPISLGVLNDRTLNFPQPIYPKTILQPRLQNNISVQIKINLQTGKVVLAKVVSGNPILRIYAEEAADQATFKPKNVEGPPLFAKGILIYKNSPQPQSKTNPQSYGLPIIQVGVINGKVIFLPKPIIPKSCSCNGKIKVRVIVDVNGRILDAVAISGNPLLRRSSEQAAIKAKFSPTNINGLPIFIIAFLEYKF